MKCLKQANEQKQTKKGFNGLSVHIFWQKFLKVKISFQKFSDKT